jgi:AraC-like DNA-binding protein
MNKLRIDTPAAGMKRRVATMLTVDERLRIDAAAMGVIRTLHRESIDEVIDDLRQYRADTIVLSTAYCQRIDTSRIARVVREFPRVPAVALLSQLDGGTARAILALGQSGIRMLIDVRDPNGWKELRSVLLSERTNAIQRTAIAQISFDIGTAPPGAHRFFEVLFEGAPRTSSVRQLASDLHVLPSTLMSRFFRAHMPPPKRYLAYARLVCAAYMFENPGVSVSGVANQLDYSSPQSFCRHVKSLLFLSAVAFRGQYDGVRMLARLRTDLLLPYQEQWRRFDPLGMAQRLPS